MVEVGELLGNELGRLTRESGGIPTNNVGWSHCNKCRQDGKRKNRQEIDRPEARLGSAR